MTIEEKARAYDEAMNKIKPLYEQAKRDGDPIWSTYEYLIPKLAENKDEKIRKALVWHLMANADFVSNGVTKEECIAYLEKQKEPHYTKRNALFDKCVENCDPKIMQKVSDEVDEILEKEQKPEKYCDDVVEEAEEYTSKVACGEYGVEVTEAYIAGVLSERNHGIELSNEDEVYLQDTLWCVKQAAKVARDENDMGTCWSAERWLKSLRSSWKPTDEQMEALKNSAYGAYQNGDGPVLRGLYEQLKKLM